MVDYAYIKIWGEVVGVVRWIEERQVASFQYDSNFLLKNWDLSPLKMPISGGNRIYTFPELIKPKDSSEDTFKGLPGLLSDSLPDKYGNRIIDKWLAQNGRAVGSMNPVEKLCFIGSRGMGALEFEPAQYSATRNTSSLEVSSLIEIARKMLSDRSDFQTNISREEEQAMHDIFKVGTSAGGARPKAIIAYNEKSGEVRSGQANAPKGFTHWILKLDGVSDAQFGESSGWGRVEYAYYLMAKSCGIQIMKSQLLEENGRAHFMTRRFDREGNDIKHHIQTLCGVQHFDYNDMYGYSYEQLFQTMRQLRLKYPEAEQMYRRMVFNVMAINYDDHTKNFAFMLSKGNIWKLAPAYDVCFSYDPDNIWVSQQTLSINGKHRGITREDMLQLAKLNNIKHAESIIDEISYVVKKWSDFASQAKVREDLYQRVNTMINV
jgi:serine/threonine-protein kinase HipA